MNDYWNDPPSEPDDYEASSESAPNYDTLEEYRMDLPPIEREPEPVCPHGREWGACDHCDFLGDIAYDSWLEKH